MKNRKEIIAEALNDLKLLQSNSRINQYAIQENIDFFKANKSIFTYLLWVIRKVSKIDKERLLEINDLLQKWDLSMHEKLIEMERKTFPGLITPLVKKITKIILAKNSQITVMNFGCGGMEAERQIITNLIANKHNASAVFIGIDRSPIAKQIIQKNLKNLEEQINFYEVENLTSEKLAELRKNQTKKYLIVLCKNNIFELDRFFKEEEIDVLFHTLFKHHFVKKEKEKIDMVAKKLAKHVIEYDGYKSLYNMIPQTIIGWNNPIFLNAEIFSHLRFPTKKEVVNTDKKSALFTKSGYYLLELK